MQSACQPCSSIGLLGRLLLGGANVGCMALGTVGHSVML